MKEIFSVFLFNRNDYDKVKKDVWIENWRGLRFFSCIAIMTFGIMSVVSMVSSSIERNFFLYIGYGFISLLFFGVSHCNITKTSHTPNGVRTLKIQQYR